MTDEEARTPPTHTEEGTESAGPAIGEVAGREFVSAMRRLARRREPQPVCDTRPPNLSRGAENT
jgi:hypothetical protein